jgi:hypothetical protein
MTYAVSKEAIFSWHIFSAIACNLLTRWINPVSSPAVMA